MIYIVSSVPRSGSSMMMRCLIGGGLDGAYDDHHEHFNVEFGTEDYQPNPNGFYALNEDFARPDLPTLYDGKVMKIPHDQLLSVPPGNYKVVFMKREPQEILASMDRFMPGLTWPEEEHVADTETYENVVGNLLSLAVARGDMQVVALNYAEVVADALMQFTTLQAAGWPIEPAKCAALVEAALHRFKLENL